MTAVSRRIRAACATLALAVCASVALGGAPAAGDRPDAHTVRAGDSASALAARYYGDPAAWRRLMEFNGRSGPDLAPGDWIRLPESEPHRVEAGETGSALALACCGDTRAWDAVARINGLEPAAPLEIGEELILPAMQERRLRRGETLATIAVELYGDAQLGVALQRLNGIDDPRRLAPGRLLRLPRLDFVRVDAPARKPQPQPQPRLQMETLPTTSPEPDAPPTPDEAAALRRARARYQAGAYRGALDALGPLAASEEHRRLAAFSWIALDEFDEACRAWRAGRDDDPVAAAAALDPVQISPKIRDVLAACAEEG